MCDEPYIYVLFACQLEVLFGLDFKPPSLEYPLIITISVILFL